MSTFTSCPLAFRFSYIERLPEPPSAPASKGTLVHLALQHLMWRPPAERTIEAALADLARAVDGARRRPGVLRARAHRRGMGERSTPTPRCSSAATSRWKTRARSRVLGVELRVTAETLDGVVIRGIIDRLELDDDGELVITDYKTGPRRRRSAGSSKSLAGVHIYSLLCERMFGRRPAARAAALPVEARVDAHGDLIGLSTPGQEAWSAAHGPSPSLFRPLLPGESREATLVFDVPPGMGGPRLLASFGVFPTQILIGDESSLLHKKTYFAL